jgi:hypothetical protein
MLYNIINPFSMSVKILKFLSFFIIISIYVTSCDKQKQTVRIVYKHSDGNIFEQSEIILYRKDTLNTAILKTNGKPVKEITLSEGYLPIIPLFITELKSITDEQKCSVVDSYTVYLDDQVIKKVDRTCQWKGFDVLKNSIFKTD